MKKLLALAVAASFFSFPAVAQQKEPTTPSAQPSEKKVTGAEKKAKKKAKKAAKKAEKATK